MKRFLFLPWLSPIVLTGCAVNPSPPPRKFEPIGIQMLRVEPHLQEQRFNVLLDFESQTDSVFVSSSPSSVKIEKSRSHTGQSALALNKAIHRISLPLQSLMTGRPFPDQWTLVGAYLYCREPANVTLRHEVNGVTLARRRLAISPGQWAAAMLDISNPSDVDETPAHSQPAASADAGDFILEFESARRNVIWCDDLILIDNRQTLVDGKEESPGGWTIRRRGFQLIGESDNGFSFVLPTSDTLADGWKVEEANELRLRLTSAGRSKNLAIYADGRAYRDGRYEPMEGASLPPAFAAQNDAPADLLVPQNRGRVNRGTPGDANNDGYNEVRGSYQLSAKGPRFEVQITPNTPSLIRPVLEVAGLPPGKVLVTVEGEWVEKTTRLENQNLLVELPGRIDRPTRVHFRVQ